MKKLQIGQLPVSQRALAPYLGISPSLLNMANTGRHGARQLGDAQSKKWEELVLAHLQSQKPHSPGPSIKKMQKTLADDCARLATKMLLDAKYAADHIPVLREQMDEMSRNHQRDKEWINTVDYLLTKLPNSAESANDRIWLQNQERIVLRRLEKNGLAAQVKLEVQIEMEKARARIYGDAVKKLQKK
jgi:hypothetical protein